MAGLLFPWVCPPRLRAEGFARVRAKCLNRYWGGRQIFLEISKGLPMVARSIISWSCDAGLAANVDFSHLYHRNAKPVTSCGRFFNGGS